MAIGRYFQNEILNNIKSRSLEVALYTSNPTAADVGNEVTGGGYSRVAVTFGANQTEADGTFAVNSEVITFPQATADWSSGAAVSHFAVRVVGGGIVQFGEVVDELGLPAPRVVRTGDIWRIPAGAIKMKFKD